jgi:hypothetical protein
MYKEDLYERAFAKYRYMENGPFTKNSVQNNRRTPVPWGAGQQVTSL